MKRKKNYATCSDLPGFIEIYNNNLEELTKSIKKAKRRANIALGLFIFVIVKKKIDEDR